LALIGDPVDHSRSPALHAAALEAVGLEGSYETIRGGSSELEQAVEALRDGTLDGVNVTMPLKMVAAGIADRLTADAAAAGSVNTLWKQNGEIWGDSTDVAAIAQEAARLPLLPVLVLGSGGAARAAVTALERDSRPLYIAARRRLAADAIQSLRPGVAVIGWGTAVAGAILVNATPLGMRGENLPAMEAAAALIDLAYGEGVTTAVACAQARGVPFVDGIAVLVAQGILSFRRWTGLEPPHHPLEVAARKH